MRRRSRKDGKIEDLVRGDCVLEALDPGRRHRSRTTCNQDVLSRDLAPVGKAHPMRVGDGRPLFDQFGPGPRQIRAIGVGEPADLLVLGRDEGRPVEGRLPHAPAKPDRIAEVVGEAARHHIELLRHAAADDASPADAAFLRDQGPRAMTGGDPRRAHAARSRADHEEIDVERHCSASVPQARAETRVARNRPSSSSSPRGRARGYRSTAFRAKRR